MIRLALFAAAALIAPLILAEPLTAVPQLELNLVKRLPHESKVFTQGFTIYQGELLESSGNYGRSFVLRRALDNPEPLSAARAPRSWFAEGLAVHDDAAWLITWREGVAQRLQLPDFQALERFRYDGQGWGLTSDGTHLIMSDGSPVIRWRDPADFSVVRELTIKAGDAPVERLNELEWVDGWLLANIWQTEWIVGIDPNSGQVGFKLSTQGLLTPAEERRADVPNGIAYNQQTGALYITGKFWPWLFEIAPTLPPLPSSGAADASASKTDSR